MGLLKRGIYKSVEELRSSLLCVSDTLRNSSFIKCGASLWRALYTTFAVSSSISCSTISQPSSCISGSEGSSKQLLLLLLKLDFIVFL